MSNCLPRSMRKMTARDNSRIVMSAEDRKREKREKINKMLTVAIKKRRVMNVVRLARELQALG